MQLKPDTLALTVVLAILTSLGPLSTDMYLPSLPAIGAFFGASVSQVQLTLSAFLFGFAVGQIFYGPLADRHGRKPVLLIGLSLFIMATAAIALAPSIETMTVARFFQALGASGPIVLARTVVRDLYSLERAGKELARMGSIMGVVPAIAPVIGGILETAVGWQGSFVAVTVFALVLSTVVLLGLPETLKTRAPEPVSIINIVRVYRELLRNGGYRGYLMLVCCTYGGLFAFISGSSFVLQGIYGLTPLLFGFAFGVCVIGFITGAAISQRIVRTRMIEGTLRIGVIAMALGGTLMVMAHGLFQTSVLAILLPMTVYSLGVGIALPQIQVGAMTPFPNRAGAASSLLGLSQMGSAAILGILVGKMLGGSAWPLPLTIAAVGLGGLIIFFLTQNAREAMIAAARAKA
jgi:DHA1 family bicyclomycin/chloramphenicol resistance-like MFS transporter